MSAQQTDTPNAKDVESLSEEIKEKTGIDFDLYVGNNYVSEPKDPHIRVLDVGELKSDFFDKKLFRSSEDKFAALINANTKKIIGITLKDGEKAKFNILFSNTSRSAFSQVLCSVGKEAELNLFEWHCSQSNEDSVVGIINETVVDARAKANIVILHSENENTAVLDMHRGTVEANGSLVQHRIYVGGRYTRARGLVSVNGNMAHTENSEVVLGTKDQRIDLCTAMVNYTKGSFALLDSKAVLADTSRCILKGFASIKDGAVSSRSLVHEKGLLLDNTARIDSLPGMSVDEYDVKATHSSATAPVEENAIFYLGSRGIGKEQANILIVDGFLGGSITSIKDPKIVAAISAILHDKVINKKYGCIPKVSEESMLIGAGHGEEGERLLEEHYKYR